ncbi:MAG: hypothetical protein V8T51_04655 [Senegalimassilia faecalis]
MPRIEESFTGQLDELEREGNKAVVVEYSVFKNRQTSMANGADVVIAVLAPLDARIERAGSPGWDEADVRNRIARRVPAMPSASSRPMWCSTTTARPSSCARKLSRGGRNIAKTLD